MGWIKVSSDKFLNLYNVTHVEFSGDGDTMKAYVYFAYGSDGSNMEHETYKGDEARTVYNALHGLV